MRKKFLIFFIITISLIFTIRLFSLQILNPDFEKLSQNNAVLAISEYPERGLIFDRNKKLIKLNHLSVFMLWSVQIWTPQPDIKDLLYPGLGHSLAALSPEGQLQHRPDSLSPSPETLI